MTVEEKKRLAELKSKRKLVHKGTWELIGHEGPGGTPILDVDEYEWTGTEDEELEYNALQLKDCTERSRKEFDDFRRKISKAFYGLDKEEPYEEDERKY